MSAPGRDAATEAQVRAARPDVSSWVAANAGSGKTRVLTDRVARLLLRGADPQRILCLTYTKAAAGEMQNRLFRRLGEWSMLEDEILRARLAELDEAALGIPDADLARARTLFARALETPGGLKIQTIHSFCEALLRRFPLEAGVSPQFEVLEDRQGAQIRSDLLETLAADLSSGFDELAPHIASVGLDPDQLLRGIISHRDRFGHDPESDAFIRAFGLDGAAPDPLAAVPAGRLPALMEALGESDKPTDARTLDALQALRDGLPGAMETATSAFVTGAGTLRKALATKAVTGAVPDAQELLEAIGAAILALADRARAEAAMGRARDLSRFARRFLSAYDERKAALAVLEFDDLIRQAGALLRRSEAADWIAYKLDGGIDHILVDEAQDTSPAQWSVIDALTREFFAGEGARRENRTVFVVGDRKQSIYSFQGAAPEEFTRQADSFDCRLADIGQELQRCELLHSFRSAPSVLRLVDRVFAARGVAEGGGDAEHVAFHADRPGRVELWPFVTPGEPGEEAPWWQAVDHPPPGDPATLLAERITRRIDELVKASVELPGAGRAIRPGDFLILVRRRGRLYDALQKQLKAAELPVAGADRLWVNSQLAVRDILSLLRAVATVEDELALAEAMRSPLMGLSEADLFRIAHGRKALLADAFAGLRGQHPKAWAMWDDLRGSADFLRPFELIQRILLRHGAAARIRARMGAEAEEAVAALLDLSLAYERVEPPTLTGFLDWMASGDPEIKRQLDASAGEVRVMTVHGAKGLESPIVILPDTGEPGGAPRRGPVRRLGADMAALSVPREEQPASMRAAEDAAAAAEAEERWRLFYVAMTRAERWLILCGGGAKPGTEDTSWYGAARSAMVDLGASEEPDGTLSISDGWTLAPVQAAAQGPGPAPRTLPDWATAPAPPPPDILPPVAPSRDGAAFAGGAAEAPVAGTGADAEAALTRGSRMHLLLEHLPGTDADLWAPRAAELLQSGPGPATGAETAALLAEARALMTDPRLAWVFAPGALTEVPVSGRVAALGGRVIRGQVDRLVTTPREVWAIDFKSDAAPPAPGAPLPPAYAGQLALYVVALSEVFPGREVRAALLWTASGLLTEVPRETVNAVVRNAAAIDQPLGRA